MARIAAPRKVSPWIAVSAALLLAGCSGVDRFTGGEAMPPGGPPPGPQQPTGQVIGQGSVRVGLILPLGATGNAGAVALAMRNAAELALAEFQGPDIQLLVKDDGGSAQGGQAAAQQAIDEGAELIIGPLFAVSVRGASQAARAQGIPMIAFSTDTSVAAPRVNLLSFLPQSDVERIVEYAVANGRRSFLALLPDNAYGNVVEGEFQSTVARLGGRVAGIERYAPGERAALQEAVRRIAQAAGQADALFIPDPSEATIILQDLSAAGADRRRLQLLGTGLWNDPRVAQSGALAGGWYAAPEPAPYANFAQRYRARFGSDPVRNATLAYDAVQLAAALVRTQGPKRFSDEVLNNSGGFAGIDGLFRFRRDGTNERGLAILEAGPQGGRVVQPAPRSFATGT